MTKILNIFVLISLMVPFVSKSQIDESFNNELYGGLVLHSSGWGGNMTYSKYVSESKRMIVELDIVSLRHPKQVRLENQQFRDSKKFIYGKLNSVYDIRVGFGRKKILAQNSSKKAVELGLVYTGGVSLAALKPVYLNVINRASITPVLERYDPNKHSVGNIYGGAPNFTGMNEMTYIPGVYAKLGIIANYSPYQNYVRAIEAGISLDYFLNPLPLLAYNDAQNLYPNLYLKFLFGRIYR